MVAQQFVRKEWLAYTNSGGETNKYLKANNERTEVQKANYSDLLN